jgi:hypothetical protein
VLSLAENRSAVRAGGGAKDLPLITIQRKKRDLDAQTGLLGRP